jgi:hypothetical protein
VKTIVRTVAEKERLLIVCALVDVVSQLVVDGVEVLFGDVDAHLDAEIVDCVHIPSAGMADYFAIARLDEHRSLPECLRQRFETKGREETLAVTNHFFFVHLAALQDGAEVEPGVRFGRRQHGVQVLPALSPHVPEQVRGNGTFRVHCTLTVLFDQFRPGVGVEGNI